jgi:L-cysteine/cystine lyase
MEVCLPTLTDFAMPHSLHDTPASLSALEAHRRQFSALSNKGYFNYGGQGPLPQLALDAILEGYRQMQSDGPFSKKAFHWMTAQAQQTRSAIAQELCVSPDTISLTDSVSAGCNIALWGLPWRKADHLLITDCEHPGIVAATQELGRRYGVCVETCPVLQTLNEGDPVAAIAAQVNSDTRLVVLSHILWNTGQVLPLADVILACRQQNPDVLILVDAAQSVGVLPLNLADLDVDFYALTGHKWLCGPDGVGALYVRPDLRDKLSPTFIGWRGIRVDEVGNPTGWKTDGTSYEMATAAFPLYRGLSEAIALHRQWGNATQRYQRICALSKRLWTNLTHIKGVECLSQRAPGAGLVSFRMRGGANEGWVAALETKQIMIRFIANPSCLRACVHYLTLESEIDEFTSTLAELL